MRGSELATLSVRVASVAPVFLLVLILFASAAGAAGRSIRLVIDNDRATVDGQEHVLEAAPQIVNNRTVVPLRFVAEAMGLQVGWDGATRTATLTGGNAGPIRLQIDNPTARVGGTPVTLDAPPFIQAGRTLVPLRFVAEALGLVVTWDSQTRAITVAPAAAGPSSPPPAATVTVNMVDNRFDPPLLTVAAGTTVVWTNGGGDDHTVTTLNGPLDSPNLPPGATFRFTFTTPGTFNYYCDLHARMDGTVIVQAP